MANVSTQVIVGLLFYCFTLASASSCYTSSNGDWELCRKNLIESIFGTPTLPALREPDYQFNVNNSSLSNNLTALVWTITDPLQPSIAPKLNATVYLSLNSSGHAPINYDPSTFHPNKGGEYKWPYWPKRRSDTLILYHNGHKTVRPDTNYDGVIWYFNELGYDTAEFDMPLYGFNAVKGVPMNHAWFTSYEQQGVHTIRYFIEPVILTVNYAIANLGYKRIIMLGLSGGGWTTFLASAVDPRIELSFPVAGGLPFDMFDPFFDSRDFEQIPDRPIYQIANMTDIFILGGLGDINPRLQIQIIHEMDSCCWTACTRHEKIKQYNADIQSTTKSNFRSVVTQGNIHEVNLRDKNIVSWILSIVEMLGSQVISVLLKGPIAFDIL